ncbi:MAG: hypothetical protein KUG50_04095 [Cycloclasticus sp.]|nr:hypothetical protein [Cycloclasticus sp.]
MRFAKKEAVIGQLEPDKRFAVDSWFHKNGIEPEIIPIKLWYSGWQPEPVDINHKK